MRYITTLLLLIFSYASQSQDAQVLTPKEMKSDLDSLHAWLHNVHPNLYAAADSSSCAKEWNKVRRLAQIPMTHSAFNKMTRSLVAQYNDGHTFVDLEMESPALDSFRKKNGRFFPLEVMIIDDQLVVMDDLSGNNRIAKGMVITKINNVPVTTILPNFKMSADFEEGRKASISRLFSWLLWEEYGWHNDYAIEYIGGKSPKTTLYLTGILVDDYFKQLWPKTNWSLELLEKENLAIIECRNYNGSLDKIRPLLDSFFRIIRDKKITNLAFDIRRNGGGNSAIGDLLLSYVTKQPIQSIRSKTFRDSRIARQLPAKHWLTKALMDAREKWKRNGEFLTTEIEPVSPMPLNDTSLFFQGNFYLLTSFRTYSSAHMTALEVKCGKLGTIIGEPTGERPNLTGEIIEFKLPHSGLMVICPTAIYKAACDLPANIGVQPDYVAAISVSDVKSGIDPVVEQLKSLCRKKG